MNDSSIEYDDNGIVVFTPEIQRQWDEVHKKIRDEYRAERRHAYMVTGGIATGMAFLGLWIFAGF